MSILLNAVFEGFLEIIEVIDPLLEGMHTSACSSRELRGRRFSGGLFCARFLLAAALITLLRLSTQWNCMHNNMTSSSLLPNEVFQWT